MTFSVRGWQGLHDWTWPRYEQALVALPGEYARFGPPALRGIDLKVIGELIVLGDRLAPLLVPIAELVVDAVSREARDGERGPLTFASLSTIDMLAACASLGAIVPIAAFDDARAVLSAVVTRRDDERVQDHWRRGLAAIALDWPQVYRGLIGQAGAPSLSFTPGERFHGNVHGFLTHLAGACEHRASPADVEPAWVDLLHNYQDLSSAHIVSTGCLFWAAWIIHARLGGRPIAEFGVALHATLYRAAGVEP